MIIDFFSFAGARTYYISVATPGQRAGGLLQDNFLSIRTIIRFYRSIILFVVVGFKVIGNHNMLIKIQLEAITNTRIQSNK
jgi:hypothetical protein